MPGKPWVQGSFAILGLLLGLGLGMALAWGAWPRGTYGDEPKELRREHKEDYIMMVADGYALQGDLEESVRRLDLLGLDNPGQAIRALIEAQPEGAESLVQLADALGMGGLLGTTHPLLPPLLMWPFTIWRRS